jgi:hypothetical protein
LVVLMYHTHTHCRQQKGLTYRVECKFFKDVCLPRPPLEACGLWYQHIAW